MSSLQTNISRERRHQRFRENNYSLPLRRAGDCECCRSNSTVERDNAVLTACCRQERMRIALLIVVLYASSLINEGVDAAAVSGALGHSVIGTTVNTPKGHTQPPQPYSINSKGSAY